MTTGKAIFWKNAQRVLRDMGMPRLDPAHGAAVDAVRWCLVVHSRPTHHRQAFLERESPQLLAYLEELATSQDSFAWRTLEERIRARAKTIQDGEARPCSRPWLAAIWHALPELAALGQRILDRPRKDAFAPYAAPAAGAAGDTSGDGDKGRSGKGGSAGATAKPRPSSRLALPAVPVVLTPAERKALDVDDDTKETPNGPEGGPGGMGGPDGKGGPK